MLSGYEQQTWEDLRRQLEAEGAEPTEVGGAADRDEPGTDDLPAAVVGGFWATILLVLFGLLAAGLVVGAATALGWGVWAFSGRRHRSGASAPGSRRRSGRR